jgi:hypothetical protein
MRLGSGSPIATKAAAVACVAIDNNPDNVAYIAFAQERYPAAFRGIRADPTVLGVGLPSV